MLGEPAVLFVDEPRANLDESGIQVVYNKIDAYKNDHVVVLATNDEDDLALAEQQVRIDA